MNRPGLRLAAALVAMLLTMPVAHMARAQELATDEGRASDRRAADELLARPTTLDVTRATLSQAIDAAAASAKVFVQYRAQVVDAYTTPVTLHLINVPLRVALDRILAGTTLHVVPDGATRLAVIDGAQRADTQPGVGSIAGVVTDATTKRPLGGATVTIDSARPVRTRDNGMFTVHGIPAGAHRVVVRLIGYRSVTTPVVVRTGQTETPSIVLAPSAATLTDVVTTATGDRRRLEVPNAVGTIKADSIVQTTLIRNVSDLLQARVPGVVVSNTDGAVGAPSKIRLRGVNSLSLNNDPIVILDGVRLNAQSTAALSQPNTGSVTMLNPIAVNGVNGNLQNTLAPSRLDDIDPNTIESIDVLRGPSASSLYGTDAANGVIVIKTKRGRAGPWRTMVTGDDGWSTVPGSMQDLWWGFGTFGGGTNSAGATPGCLLATGTINVLNGYCVQDSVVNFNPQNDPDMRTLGTGTTQSLQGTLSGGSDQLQQFLSARVANAVGIAKMSDIEKRLIGRLWSSPAPSWMVRPNTEQNIDGSSRTTFRPLPTADISVSAQGIYRSTLNGGAGTQPPGMIGGGLSPSDTLGFLPSESQRTKINSIAKRGVVSSTGDYRPVSWLSLTGVAGGDYTVRTDGADLRAQDCTTLFDVTCPSAHTTRRNEIFVKTLNGGAVFSFAPAPWISLRTSVGENYAHTDYYMLQVGNNDPSNCPLAFGSTLLTPPPVCADGSEQTYRVFEDRDESATAGLYFEQSANLLGVDATVGIRKDVASAFGSAINNAPPTYPKFGISYPISEQPFFPKQSVVSSLRFRLAYGQSGNQASQTAVRNTWQTSQETFAGSSGSSGLLAVQTLGNPALRPERGTEWEGGVDVSFLENERLHAEVTVARKFTRDAIAQSRIGASYGVGTTEFINLGNVSNHTFELLLNAKLFDRPILAWDLTINASSNTNKLVHKAPGLLANVYVQQTQLREGYPLYGYWGVPVLSYADANGDGILSRSEISFGPVQFMGAPYPRSEITYSNGFSLFRGVIRVNASFDQINGLSQQMLLAGGFTRGAVDRTAPLSEQAAWIQSTLNNGYLAETSSLRFNELSVTYTVPAATARRLLHVQSAAVTFAGRNLALWTDYAGKDPNVDTSGLFGEPTSDNGGGVPQPRNFTMRFTLGL